MHQLTTLIFSIILSITTCSDQNKTEPSQTGFYFVDQTNSLPSTVKSGNTMAIRSIDIDSDGDLDLVLAREYQRNRILINNGSGIFNDESESRFPNTVHDSEDIAIADFDGDGDLDIIFVSENDPPNLPDGANEYYENDGTAHFALGDAGRIPVRGRSNAVASYDFDSDGDLDLIIGNNGQSNYLANNGSGYFTDETNTRMPTLSAATQDIELADVDGDQDIDIVFANEDDNFILINSGSGVFSLNTDAIPINEKTEETRELNLIDFENDGDLDIFFSNVARGVQSPSRLLINSGSGQFSDQTISLIPNLITEDNFGSEFVDLNNDKRLDLVTGNFRNGLPKLYLSSKSKLIYQSNVFPSQITGDGIDIEIADFNGDSIPDIYLSTYRGTDYLLFGKNK